MKNARLLAPALALALTAALASCSSGTSIIPLAPTGDLLYGLTSAGQLAVFGSGNAAASTRYLNISGLASGDTLVDIDVNPNNGLLYGFAGNGRVYTIETGSGAATLNTTPLTALSTVKTDFNPAANRVRVVAGNNTNARLSVSPAPSAAPAGTVTADGTFAYADGTVGTPNLQGAAYTSSALNNGTAPSSTALYSVDASTNALLLHSVGPQFSAVSRVGSGLGLTLGSSVGFDIVTKGGNSGTNTAYLSSGTGLYTVNLTTGAATSVATLPGALIGLAGATTAQ